MKIIKSHKNIILASVLIVCAVIARVLGNNGFHSVFCGLIRTLIYIGLYIGWGISISKRIMQAQVRRYMISISGLMVFWFILRTTKYFFTYDPVVSRYLWYWYYFPMLFIPLLCVFVSMSLGKGENFRLPKWIFLLYIPTVLCLLAVLTNDFHQFIFTFPQGEVWTDKNNGYSFLYYIVIGWEIICALTAFVIMIFKCRLSQRKKYLPFILIFFIIVYGIIYSTGAQWLRLIGGDITAAQCLMITGILECCIQCGLIQTNSGYKSLFAVGTIGAQITDTEYNTRYASSNAPKLTKDVMQSTKNGTVKLDKNTLLKSSKIDGGYVLWQEDITDITAVLERLEENKETIAQSNYLEQENYKTKVKINTIREKNRLYDRLQAQSAHQIKLLDKLLKQYDEETDPEIRRSLLAKTAVIGAYIKRRGNLMFIGEKSEITDTAELSACLDESFANLELMGVECAIDIPNNNKIYVRDAIRVYDFFETVTEAAIDDISSVWLKARSLADTDIFNLETESNKDLSEFSALADSCIFEDGVWRFTLRITKAGEQA